MDLSLGESSGHRYGCLEKFLEAFLPQPEVPIIKVMIQGTSLAVQWLRPCASSVGGVGSIPGWRTKMLYAAWHSQKKKRDSRPRIKFSLQSPLSSYVCVHCHTHPLDPRGRAVRKDDFCGQKGEEVGETLTGVEAEGQRGQRAVGKDRLG